jgi:hypothetical protein
MNDQKHFFEDEDGLVEKLLMDEAIRKGAIDEGILKRVEKDQYGRVGQTSAADPIDALQD